MSPEQAAGTAIDGRSDLYSLGVTAFFVLTGRLPFEAPTVMGLLTMHLTQSPPPVAAVRAGLPPKLSAAVDRCLAKDPANRFATGEQLAEAMADARGAHVQIAPAVRGFLRDRARTGYEVVLLYFAVIYLGSFGNLPFLRAAGPLSLLAVGSVVRLFQTARRLLRAGYTFDDVRLALETESEERREEIGLTVADDARLQRAWRFRVASAFSIVTGFLIIPVAIKARSVPLAIVGGASVVAGLLLIRRANTNVPYHQRRSQLGRWFDRLWQGRFGKWFFAAAQPRDESIVGRLRRWLGGRPAPTSNALPPAAAIAPTEVLLARAADSLLDALPASARAQLGAGRDSSSVCVRRSPRFATAKSSSRRHSPRQVSRERRHRLSSSRLRLER